ncbi:hypothetical protein PA64_00084 [Pseudomonas aeruginosa]|uniref:ATP-binding protein n=2 Tax=Pseudomonas aeruginosa TaxID=287 RepID=UPI000DEFBAF4|nr:ATP-binding protein [Pseudomonas aeruginosa]RCM17891.1 hypothetical protein PA64_00084 [Pseudomonas aeruginosa]
MSESLKHLELPETYEKITALLGGSDSTNTLLSRFILPIQDAEKELSEITAQTYGDGKVIFILGKPGIGKSTFIHSLAWRPTIEVCSVTAMNCSEVDSGKLLEEILENIRKTSKKARANRDLGHTAIVLDYIENLEEQDHTKIRAFFRTLNGLLRSSPILILWPVTDLHDVKTMIGYASAVSSTVFVKGKEILSFSAPPISAYPSIAKNTISVLNDGLSISDFNLTDEDFDELLKELRSEGEDKTTLRNYLLKVRQRWSDINNYLQKKREKVPQQTEIWFVIAYPDAENIAGQFSRKSKDVFDAWIASHEKLSEYIHNNQKEAAWDAKRLQYALTGNFTTRILYLPANTLASTVCAYGEIPDFPPSNVPVPTSWFKKETARKTLRNSPLVRQLLNQHVKMGKRRGGTASQALIDAAPVYKVISERATGKSIYSDHPFNKALKTALQDVLGNQVKSIDFEKVHPWLPSIRPDIQIKTNDDRIVCIEMHYTSRQDSYILADYILEKLDKYMRQLDRYIRNSQLRLPGL